VKRRHRVKKFNNLKNSHKIGILWAGDKPDEFKAISKFHQEMQAIGKQVDILCYFPGKVLPDRYTALRYMNCFKSEELNFLYTPRQKEAIDFMNTPYEILIDINFNKHFPLFYISAMSMAEFKIGAGGRFRDENADMTIELGDNEGIDYFLEQVKYYLEMINAGA
jgi:hypothetical protein